MRPAVVYCWVKADSQDEAERIARLELDRQCWNVLQLDCGSAIEPGDLEINPETARRAAQADASGFYCEFHEKTRAGRIRSRTNPKLPRLLIGTLVGSVVGIVATMVLLDNSATRSISPLGFVAGLTLGLALGFFMDLAHQRREKESSTAPTASPDNALL